MIQPNDFFLQSKELLGLSNSNRNQEVYLRSALSRAYYALFHEARSYLEGHYNSEFKSAITECNVDKISNVATSSLMHRVIPETLLRIKKKNAQHLGYKFKKFRDLRNMADYELEDNSFTFNITETTLTDIEGLIQNIKTL